ncbi:MAG: caspase family protein, partial [Prochlorotrichaceae cyanobacterium]
MAQKTALLIGVTEYGEGIPNLTAPANDVAAIQRVLEDPAMGGFDRVQTLVNPDGPDMQEAIFNLFDQASKDDFVLLFFSGHGITDD